VPVGASSSPHVVSTHVEYADLPFRWAHALARGGYVTRAAVAAASDDDLLAIRSMGIAGLAAIRRVIPVGVPTPVGPALPWALAAGSRQSRALARNRRAQEIRRAVVRVLTASGPQIEGRLRVAVVRMAHCRERDARVAIAQLVKVGTVERIDAPHAPRERLYRLRSPVTIA
jgi:hypothetical protein